MDLREPTGANNLSPSVNNNYKGIRMVKPARTPLRLRHRMPVLLIAMLAAIGGAVLPCHADVITDWDAKASAVASPAALGQRELAIVDIAMFDAVNSILPKFRPYLVKEDGFSDASAEAAAASAAAGALERLHPQSAAAFEAALEDYVQKLPATHAAIAQGMRLGELVAQRIYDSRADDSATGFDSYRPRTQPGVYVPTAPVVAGDLADGTPVRTRAGGSVSSGSTGRACQPGMGFRLQ